MIINQGEIAEYGHDIVGFLLGPSVSVRITPRNGEPFTISMPVAIAHALYVDAEEIASVLIFHGSLIDAWGGSC